jgi:redox-sensitive bicupin YhaK (pirin superfamily)
MIEKRPFAKLGGANHGWLHARHHFSFADYHDPSRMNWGALRVWNDDEIAPNSGFPPHPHANMEIVTYVRKGAITHKDSLGNEGRTEAGDVQVMHAGTGIVHAEYNLEKMPTRLFQIWILPAKQGVEPGWGTRAFPKGGSGALTPLADGRPGANGTALPLYADAAVLAGTLRKGETVRDTLRPGRAAYLVPASGAVSVNGVAVNTRDGATITGETELTITAAEDSEVVLVDVVG